MKVIILRFSQLKVLIFSSDKQLRAAFMAVTVVTVLLLLPSLWDHSVKFYCQKSEIFRAKFSHFIKQNENGEPLNARSLY